MKVAINWDESGFENENVLDILLFALNKEGKCKNSNHVLFNNPDKIARNILDTKIKYNLYSELGNNDEDKECISIEINEDLPIYVKEIVIYAYDRNFKPKSSSNFMDLEFFNVEITKNNDKHYYSLKKEIEKGKINKANMSKVFEIGRLVKTYDDVFVWSSTFEFQQLDLIKLCKQFDISPVVS